MSIETLRDHAERVLAGTGLSPAEALDLAREHGDHPAATALRDGYHTAQEANHQ